jgi:hypothetical protein
VPKLLRLLVCLFVLTFAFAIQTHALCSVSISSPSSTTVIPYGQTRTVSASWSGVRVTISGNHTQGTISGAGVSMSYGSQTGWTGNNLINTGNLNPGTASLSWFCSDVNGSNHGTHSFMVGPKPDTGFVTPKYVVLSVLYAPPGSSSSVDYGTSTNLGTSTSTSSSFSDSVTKTVTVSKTIGLATGIAGVDVHLPTVKFSTSNSTSDTVEQDSSSSFAITKQSSSDKTVLGPSSSTVGLDHDFDVVKIWLNPVINFTLTPGNVELTNIYYDDTDINDMDIIYLTLGQLKDPTLITDQFQLNQLSRAWAPLLTDGTGPGLTAADLLEIAKADPFSDPTYVPATAAGQPCTTGDTGRFCISTNPPAQYASPQQGGQGGSTKYTESYSTTATQGQSSTDTHSTSYSTDASISGGFLSNWSLDVKNENKLTWTNKWSTQTSKTSGQSASATIVPPKFTDNYNGPTEFAVYQDSVYGTFMFLPVPFPGFMLAAGPASKTTTPGGSATYSVTTSVIDGGTGTAAFSVASGLPTGATASFSPASVTVGGASTLTVTTSASTPAGTYTLTIDATIGTNLPHATQVTLVVNAAPDFSLSSNPSSQTVTVGGSTTFTVSAAALNGFTGAETLSLAGLPTGASATFSPTSIGGTGTSTLTVATSSSTPAGGYTLTITGTSGTLTHSIPITLVVQAPVQDFSIAITPQSIGVTAGGSATYTVSTTAINGFAGSVTLSLAGLPSGASATFAPTSITGAGSSTLTVTTSTTTPKGTYTLTATGVSGALDHAVSSTLTVN